MVQLNTVILLDHFEMSTNLKLILSHHLKIFEAQLFHVLIMLLKLHKDYQKLKRFCLILRILNHPR